MRTTRLVLVLVLLLLLDPTRAAEPANEWQGKKVPSLILADGKTYTDVTFTKVEADAITITHAGGILRIPMEALKPEAQAALGYDPEKAAEARKASQDAAREREAAALAASAASLPDSASTIPGIAAVDVHGNLDDRGFQTQRTSGGGEMMWTSKDENGTASFIAEVHGSGPTKIKSIRATALVFDPSRLEKISAEFLGFVATVPYDGARPAEAREWVVQNISRNAQTVIGGVKFEIFANAPAARIMRMAPAK